MTSRWALLLLLLQPLLLGFGSATEDATSAVSPALTVKTAATDQVFEPANSLPSRSEAAAVQPVVGIGQRVKMRSNEKKDLGTLGYVLGLLMMVIIIAIGAGIVVGYAYKRQVKGLCIDRLYVVIIFFFCIYYISHFFSKELSVGYMVPPPPHLIL
ncbi:Hypothetical predicted protein [Podarcis lilfordi]|uniref:Uncharacterized protein n=1 Tax=Podarcis lilfordi TaxID=74358 RepID=A0AA35PTE7_9SAUR|nr:Hypothetical predicted protein [Podarcis lilfordi]